MARPRGYPQVVERTEQMQTPSTRSTDAAAAVIAGTNGEASEPDNEAVEQIVNAATANGFLLWSDLTARLAVATDDDMAEMFQAARVMMQPYDATNAHLRITSIVDKGDGVAKVAWSDGYKMNAYAKGATVTVPAGIIPSPGSAIMSEVEYTYTSPFTFVLGTDTVVKDKFYLRPRRVNEINRVHDSDDDGTSSVGLKVIRCALVFLGCFP